MIHSKHLNTNTEILIFIVFYFFKQAREIQQLGVDLQLVLPPFLLPWSLMGLSVLGGMAEGNARGQLLILSFKHKICYTTLSVTQKAIILRFNFPLNGCTGDQSLFFFFFDGKMFCYLFVTCNKNSTFIIMLSEVSPAPPNSYSFMRYTGLFWLSPSL